MIGNGVELIRSEDFDEDEVDELLAENRCLGLDLRDLLFRVGAVQELQPIPIIILYRLNKVSEDRMFGQLLDLLQLLFIEVSAEELSG